MADSSLRIALVTLNYKPYSGGVVSSLIALTTELKKQGHQPIIMALNFTGHDQKELGVERLACWGRIRYKHNPLAIPINPTQQLIKLFERHKPDIVHVHHPFILGPAAVTAARKLKIPVLFTHHSLYEQYTHYIPLPSIITRPMCKQLVKKFCNTVDQIVAPSRSIYDHLKYQMITIPISVIPSSIMSLFESLQQTKKPTTTNRTINLLTVSRFVPEKNIEWLLDAYHKLLATNTHTYLLRLVGYGAWQKQLEHYAYQQLGLTDQQVLFIEKPPKSTLLELYQNADIFVLASQSETQGLVHAEAMSQSTPVVALAGSGTNDIIKSGVNGFLVQTKDEFIQKINQIMSDQHLFDTLQHGAYQTAREYFAPCLTGKMVELYRSLLTKKRDL